MNHNRSDLAENHPLSMREPPPIANRCLMGLIFFAGRSFFAKSFFDAASVFSIVASNDRCGERFEPKWLRRRVRVCVVSGGGRFFLQSNVLLLFASPMIGEER